MRGLLSVSAAGLCLIAANTARADASLSADQIVAARQAAFALMGGLTGAIKATLDAGGDISKLGGGAQAISEYAALIPTLFPAGTEKAHNTKAKPEVWSDAAGFKKADEDFILAAGKFNEAVKSGDKAAVGAAFGDLGKGCGGCHKGFRERDAK